MKADKTEQNELKQHHRTQKAGFIQVCMVSYNLAIYNK